MRYRRVTEPFSVRLDPKTRVALDHISEERRQPIAEVIRDFVDEGIRARGRAE